MTIYQTNAMRGSGCFKVNIADEAGNLRVIGIFPTKADAEVWIEADRRRLEHDRGGPNVPG